MAVKITSDEPNTFPAVDAVYVTPKSGSVEMILVTRVEGQATRVAVKLNTEQADQLGRLLLGIAESAESKVPGADRGKGTDRASLWKSSTSGT